MPPRLRRAAWAVVLLAAGGADAFYIPGVHPQNFDVGEEVPLKVGRVISTLSSLPFEYYRMPMCQPDEITSSMANLGEVLTGDVLYSSPYTLRMQINDSCAELCNVPHFGVTGRPSNLWKSLVEMGYRVTMRMDNMPAVELVAVDGQDGNMNPEQRQQLSQSTGEDPVLAFVGQVGLPLGAVKPMGDADIRLVPREHRDYFVNNHINFWVFYHPLPKTKYTVYANGLRVRKPCSGDESDDSDCDMASADPEGSDPDGPDGDAKPETFEGSTGRIVGLYVMMESIKGGCKANSDWKGAEFGGGQTVAPKPQLASDPNGVTFSYSVYWVPSETRWASRWDTLLQMSSHDVDTNWFSIANSLLVTTCVTFIVAAILVRSLRRDLLRYEEMDDLLGDSEEGGADGGGAVMLTSEDYGWKLVANDVFRPPPHARLLCVLYGVGMQLFFMCFITLALSLAGIFSPSNRGGLLSCLLISFSLLAFVAGSKSAWLYQALDKEALDRRNVALRSAMLAPGLAMLVFCSSNTLLWASESSGAVPFGTFVALFALWFIVAIPLAYVGSVLAYRREPEKLSGGAKTHAIPRLIPPVPVFRSGTTYVLVGGLVPFATSFAQIFFVISRVYLNQFVYMFGFIFVSFCIVLAVMGEVAIITTYWSLNAEDYRWWWRSYGVGFMAGVYTFSSLVLYFTLTVGAKAGTVNLLVLYGHVFLGSLLYALVAGAVGFRTSLAFVRAIYGAIKAD